MAPDRWKTGCELCGCEKFLTEHKALQLQQCPACDTGHLEPTNDLPIKVVDEIRRFKDVANDADANGYSITPVAGTVWSEVYGEYLPLILVVTSAGKHLMRVTHAPFCFEEQGYESQAAKIVQSITYSMRASEPFGQAQNLAKLHKLSKNGQFQEHLEEMGIGYRKARYLISVIENLNRLGYDHDHVRQLVRDIGWTKAAIILRGLDKKRSTQRLAQEYKVLKVPAVKKAFPSPKAQKRFQQSRLLGVYVRPATYAKLMRHLEDHCQLPKAKGKRVGLSKAFETLVQDLG